MNLYETGKSRSAWASLRAPFSLRFMLLFMALLIWPGAKPASAMINTTCPGNVCANSVNVGGQQVDYFWTQNMKTSNSSLKVKFRSGPYAGGAGTVRFKVTVDTAFTGVSTLKNPDPTVVLPPTQSVDVANTWVERDGTPAAGQKYDFVQEMTYDTLPTGPLNLTIDIAQYGVLQTFTTITVPLQVVQADPAAMTNRHESEAFPSPPYAAGYLPCYDGLDNDLNYVKDCADADCAGALIATSPKNAYCENPHVTCNDGLDHAGNGLIDCADPVCNGRPGNPAGDKFCGPENGGVNHANCIDGFDNDGNGKIDCHDDMPGTGCYQTGFADCAKAENIPADYNTTPTATPCAADADCAGISCGPAQPGKICRYNVCACAKTADQLCDLLTGEGTIDHDRDGLAGCQDPACSCLKNPDPGDTPSQCAMKRHCAPDEAHRYDQISNSIVLDLSQCANGKDNDGDGKIGCADPACIQYGSPNCARYEAWLPPAALGTGAATSTPDHYFNYCTDGLDNDGDGKTDGTDPACFHKFGECAPANSVGLVATENFNFLSCSDGLDHDQDGFAGCQDTACRSASKLGRAGCTTSDCGSKYLTTQTDAATCAANEAAPVNRCGDGLDNTGIGKIDCQNPQCSGVPHGPAMGSLPAGYTCGTETGALCHDGYDNNGNGNIDCFDSSCQDGVQCAQRPPVGWTTAPCIAVPDTTALAPIAAPGGSVQFAHNDRIHVNDAYAMRFTGSGLYTSLTIVIGDAIDPTRQFPFNAQNCALSGTGAAQMSYVGNSPKVGTLFEKATQTLNGFDVTLTCTPTSAVPVAATTFTVAIVANHGGAIEFGQSTPTVQVYENIPPVWSPTPPAPTPGPAIDAEGIVGGKVSIPVGGTVRFQGKPGDPAPSSGICSCGFVLNGTAVSTDGNCLATSPPIFANMPNYQVTLSATDGANNQSAVTSMTVNVNVLPTVKDNLTFASTRTTYMSGAPITFHTAFQFASPIITPVCRVYVCTDSFTCAQQDISTVSLVASGAGTNVNGCDGTYTPPAALAGDRYWLFVETTDPNGNIIRSNLQSYLKCDWSDVGPSLHGACMDADFDNDGVPEGRYTPSQNGVNPPGPTYPGPSPRACDNCINLYNPDQKDLNANGIGDACEASAIGRCEYKRCSGSAIPCLTDADCGATRCIVVDQQMCTINCTTATQATDCALPGPVRNGVCNMDWGVCADTNPPGAPDIGNCCFNNSDCTSGKCASLIAPYLQTLNGQIYSGGDIKAGETPPQPNATYCLQANGAISNFTSKNSCQLPGQSGYQIPSGSNNYMSQFGSLDVAGILGGKYGPLTTGVALPSVLGGQIYLYDPGTTAGLTISGPIVFNNGSGMIRGNGLIIVKGDLVINANVFYQDVNPSDLKLLGSVGWIVLKNSTCNSSNPLPNGCGNVIINGNVTGIVGAVFAEGQISTGASSNQLNATGMWVAKSFSFGRTYASRTTGSEKVNFDARVLLNPPPGMTDVTRSLPGFKSVPGQ